MNFNDYQATMVQIWESDKTPEEELLFCSVGMTEEAGECMGKVKRWMRGEGFDREGYLKELGDVLAYLVMAHHSVCQMGVEVHSLSRHLQTKPSKPSIDSGLIQVTVRLSTSCLYVLDTVLEKDINNIDWRLTGIFNCLRWCLAADEIQSTFEEVMELNIKKLADRKARNGNLRGSGDNR